MIKTTKKIIPFIFLLLVLSISGYSQKISEISEKTNTLGGVAKNIEVKYELPIMVIENKLNNSIISSINTKLRKPYIWGSVGPKGYDCSGFVWKVFSENKIIFTRSTAKQYYRKFKPVNKDDRFKTGTLVFFSNLKHVGIVLDDKGFYHASKSKGITYSRFNSYWTKRIVGFRKVN